jgi:Ca2+/H+ antiporter, TMEM165/GDT1 family
MTAVLTAIGAALAVAVELLEALAIVVAVGVSRRWSDAVIGAAAAVAACALVAAALLAGAVSDIPLDTLRAVIGTLLLLFGLEWLRKGTLRLAGRRARSSSLAEYEQTRRELLDTAAAIDGPDWAARAVAFKGVLLEGIEIVVIVVVLGSAPGAAVPAAVGALAAVLAVCWAGFRLRPVLERVPETELKWGVGVMLTSFGTFFAGEGLAVDWPAGELALLYIAAIVAAISALRIRQLETTPGRPA